MLTTAVGLSVRITRSLSRAGGEGSLACAGLELSPGNSDWLSCSACAHMMRFVGSVLPVILSFLFANSLVFADLYDTLMFVTVNTIDNEAIPFGLSGSSPARQGRHSDAVGRLQVVIIGAYA